MLAETFEALEIDSEYSATLESLHLLGLSYRTAGLEIRSALSFSGEKRDSLFKALQSLGIDQALVLSTCNRTELYLASPAASELVTPALEWLAAHSGVEQHHLRLGEQNAHKGDALQFAR